MKTKVMKISTLFCGLLIGFIFCSCGDDDEASPSHLEKDWYVIEYDPNAGELDQLIYDIYDKTGFPIFYNDTLGSQTRYNKGGEPYTYYEIFQPGYAFTSFSSNFVYTLEHDEGKLENMIEILRDYMLEPYFKKEYGSGFKGKYGPHAILVLDTLNKNKTTPDSLYRDLGLLALSTRNMVSIGKQGTIFLFKSIDQLTEEDKVDYGWKIAMYELKRYFDINYEDEIKAYYDVTKEPAEPDPNPSQGTDCYELGKSFNIKNYGMDVTNPRKYGTLVFGLNNGSSIYMPSQLQDLSAFARMIYTKTDAEIRAEHVDYEMIIRRYEMLLQLFKDSGLTQFIKEQ